MQEVGGAVEWVDDRDQPRFGVAITAQFFPYDADAGNVCRQDLANAFFGADIDMADEVGGALRLPGDGVACAGFLSDEFGGHGRRVHGGVTPPRAIGMVHG